MQIPRKVTKRNIWKTSVTISDNCFWVWCCLVMPGATSRNYFNV